MVHVTVDAVMVLSRGSQVKLLDADWTEDDWPPDSYGFVGHGANEEMCNDGYPGADFLQKLKLDKWYLLSTDSLKSAIGECAFDALAAFRMVESVESPFGVSESVYTTEADGHFRGDALAHYTLVVSPGDALSQSYAASSGPVPACLLDWASALAPPGYEATPGSGKCSAYALQRIGIFESAEEACWHLDLQMSLFPNSNSVLGECWSIEVIQKTVVQHGWHFRKLVIEETCEDRVDLLHALGHGSFFMYGHVNRSFYKGGCKMDTSDDTSNDPKDWEHSCAVVGGRFFEFNAELQKMVPFSVKWLWLQTSNKPDPARGYFRDISAVYRVWRCSIGSDCKGRCCRPAAPRVRAARVGHRRSARASARE